MKAADDHRRCVLRVGAGPAGRRRQGDRRGSGCPAQRGSGLRDRLADAEDEIIRRARLEREDAPSGGVRSGHEARRRGKGPSRLQGEAGGAVQDIVDTVALQMVMAVAVLAQYWSGTGRGLGPVVGVA